MAAAVECLVDLGYQHTSYARIAERAELSSTRLISYHFTAKDELMQAIVDRVFDRAKAAIRPRMAAVDAPAEKIATFIRASLDWYAADRREVLALREIWNNFRDPDGRLVLGPLIHEPEYEEVIGIFRAGQAAVELRDFDPRAMAVALRSTLGGASEQIFTHTDLDVPAYAEELVALFDAATRKEISG